LGVEIKKYDMNMAFNMYRRNKYKFYIGKSSSWREKIIKMDLQSSEHVR
jgi:hypothetical protein